MSVITKTGDNGTTHSPFGRVNKNHPFVNAVGALDELQANLGFLYSLIRKRKKDKVNLPALAEAMQTIYLIQSDLYLEDQTYMFNFNVKQLEEVALKLEAKLPPLKQFIIPNRGVISSYAHVSRTVCRRAERAIVAYITDEQADFMGGALVYINRLSDYLFILARLYEEK